MAKSADAFRTISEVADWLGTPAHVLRFWESKFSQIKPVKRAGGRRYYRPADMELIGGIKKLLHDDGMTIKGVQKMLREKGVKYVAGLSQPIGEEGETVDASPTQTATPAAADEGSVIQFQRSETEETPAAETAESDTTEAAPSEDESLPGTPASDTSVLEDFASAPDESVPEGSAPDAAPAEEVESDAAEAEEPAEAPALPAFLHRSAPAPEAAAEDNLPPEPEAAAEPEPESEPEPEPLRPAQIDLPPDPADSEISAPPGLLSAIAARRGRPLSEAALAQAIALRDRLATHHDRLAGKE
ncbi:MerR family transcriptional regulator [Marimonas lutisalis]|uniref:MerR family transcriptional regulator n=1 Tax=Marimonas lutisalis TaxID=2545756 RepID=UPI001F244228|nr:MerR family transcriptional regulator [Marimonas lutisalis]